MMNVATAAAEFAACYATKPPNMIMCVMAAAALAQAGQTSGGQGSANNVAAATEANNTGGTTAAPVPGAGFGAGGGGGFVSPEAQAIADGLKNMGVVMSPDGSSVSLPDGRNVSTADIGAGKVPGVEMNDQAKEQIAKIESDVRKNSNSAHVVAIGLDGGGGGGGAGSSETAGKGFNMAAYLKSLNKRDPASVNGLSKKLGEDNIGIKSDNIFEMVSRQYKRKQSQSAFLTN